MVWKQCFESGDISNISELESIIESLKTDGEIQRISFEIEADAPINVAAEQIPPSTESPPEAEAESTAQSVADEASHEPETEPDSPTATYKYSTSGSSIDTQTETTSPETSSTSAATEPATDSSPESEAVESNGDEAKPVSVRKWPRMHQELGSDCDLPIAAAAYPSETVDFSGNKKADVEHDTPYYAKVNGTKDYGAFLTLNGSGYSPRSQYDEVTGLLHHSEMLEKGPFDYSQGDGVVVELVTHDDSGLSFRELPLLSMEEAKQARHVEVIRFNRLNISEGDRITFGEWPEDRELTGNVISLNNGSDDPPRPPTLKVQTSGATHTIRPSEVVATATPIDASASPSDNSLDTVADSSTASEAAATPSQTQPATPETTTTAQSNEAGPVSAATSEQRKDGPTTGTAASPMSAAPDDSATTSEEAAEDGEKMVDDAEDAEDTEDEELECACGETFEKEQQMWGHQSSCTPYKERKDEGSEATAAEEGAAATTDGGTVLNPILLEARYDYFQVAATLHLADAEYLSVQEVAEAVDGTDWDLSKGAVNSHLTSLREKEAVTRQKDSVYEYTLTDRGTAGVEDTLDGLKDERIPDF